MELSPEMKPGAPPGQVGRVSRSAVRDTPAKVDTLGFGPYVEAIAAFLDAPGTQPPLTMSIEGEWGSGKSSFMGQLADALSQPGRSPSIVVSFNAWRFDKSDAMWAAFAQAVGRELRKRCSWFERVLGAVRLFALRVKGPSGWLLLGQFVAAWLLLLATLFLAFLFLVRHSATQLQWMATLFPETEKKGGIPAIYQTLLHSGVYTGAAGVLLAALSRSVKWLKGWLFGLDLRHVLLQPDYGQHGEFLHEFQADFGKVIRAYAGNRKVFVFVDDLDRCDLPKAAELMQAINLMIGENDRLMFVLGLDREKVAAAVAAKYKDLLPFLGYSPTEPGPGGHAQHMAFGYEFMEKFIQLSFRIPRPSSEEVLRRFLRGLTTATAPEAKQSRAERKAPVSAGAAVVYRRLETGEESEEIVSVILMVCGVLGNNPRRLKQFLNSYRLALYLASAQGFFDLQPESGASQLSFQQLGKLTALFLRYPQLPTLLDETPSMLADAEAALQAEVSSPSVGREGLPWADLLRDAHTVELLLFGLSGPEGALYSFRALDIRACLRVMPLVPGPETAELERGPQSAPRNGRDKVSARERTDEQSLLSRLAGPNLAQQDTLLRRALQRDRGNRAGSEIPSQAQRPASSTSRGDLR